MRDRLTFLNLLLTAAAVGLYAIVITLSTRWIGRRERKVLRDATGREPQQGEEDSIGTWLKVPSPALDDLNNRLKADPFDPLEDVAERQFPGGTTPDKAPYSKPPLEDDGKG